MMILFTAILMQCPAVSLIWCWNFIPSKLVLQYEALLSLTTDQQWKETPLCIQIKTEQHKRIGF